MMLFCPSCSNLLTITTIPTTHCTAATLSDAGKHRFECRTCPYQMVLDKKYFDRKTFEFGKVEDVLGGEESWRNVERTAIKCPKEGCEGQEAYFKQMQTRSADEPMTSIYKCVDCGGQWREG